MKNYFKQETISKVAKNYHLVKDTIEGRFSQSHIKVAKRLVVVALGVVGVCKILPIHEESYEFNPNYANYAQQVECTKEVEFQSFVEDKINELQNVVITAQAYQESDPTLTKIKTYESLAKDYSKIRDNALNTLKYSVAKDHGGNFKDYSIRYEDSDGSWIASNQEIGGITLTGDERDLACNIVRLQDFESLDLYDLSESKMDDYVTSCLNVSKNALSLAVENLGEKKK